jgi:hypothetical protein
MRRLVAAALVAAGLVTLGAAVTARARQGQGVAKIEQAILAASAEMASAGEALDADRLFAMMLDTDKGSVIQNGVFMATRAEALGQVKAGFNGVSKVEYRWKRQHVTVLSPEAALLTAEGESVVTIADGRVITTPFAQSVVFTLRDGKWRALHAHQSSPRG